MKVLTSFAMKCKTYTKTFLILGSNEVLGKAVIGAGAGVRPDEKLFFEEMFRSKKATAQWIPLQDLNNIRTNSAN